jgi:hypothetical protein
MKIPKAPPGTRLPKNVWAGKIAPEDRPNQARNERRVLAKLARQSKICSICGNSYEGFGNNAWPINDGRCCDDCNKIVIARRVLEAIRSGR